MLAHLLKKLRFTLQGGGGSPFQFVSERRLAPKTIAINKGLATETI